MNDLFNSIFLKICLHAAVSYAAYLVWLILESVLGGEGSSDSLLVCIFVVNCTTLILCKLNRILERLPRDDDEQ